MKEASTISLHLVSDKLTGEHKAIISSEDATAAFVFNLEELKSLREGIDEAIKYIEEHGTYITESAPEGAVRH